MRNTPATRAIGSIDSVFENRGTPLGTYGDPNAWISDTANQLSPDSKFPLNIKAFVLMTAGSTNLSASSAGFCQLQAGPANLIVDAH